MFDTLSNETLKRLAGSILTPDVKHALTPRPVKCQVTAADASTCTIVVKGVDPAGSPTDHTMPVEYVGVQPQVGDSVWVLDMGHGRWLSLGPVGNPAYIDNAITAAINAAVSPLPKGVLARAFHGGASGGAGVLTFAVIQGLSFTVSGANREIEIKGIMPRLVQQVAAGTMIVKIQIGSDDWGQIYRKATMGINEECSVNGSVWAGNLAAGTYTATMTATTTAGNLYISDNSLEPAVGAGTATGVSRLIVIDHGA